jgi:Fic family protein
MFSGTPESAYKWQPITDLPDKWQELTVPDLASLARVWVEQHDKLKESQAVKEFKERLQREWAIETGILERLYTLDVGITQLLIEHGINAALIPHGATNRPVNEVITILQDHRDALEGLFDFVANRLPLTTSYIRQLHQVITRHQQYVEGRTSFGNPVAIELERGNWKKWANNPTRPDGSMHEYSPPEQVVGEMERLVMFHNTHEAISPEVSAAWLHHRFTQIHPFQDGNGRVARALATIVFLKAGWFPLVINRQQRAEYISALEAADGGNLAPLVKLFGQNAKQAFVRAMTLSEDVLRETTTLPKMVESLVELYQTRQEATEESYQQVEFLAAHLSDEAYAALDELATQIRQKFVVVDSPPTVQVTQSNESNEHYYTSQIISVAEKLNYWANITRRRAWVRLHLVNGQKTQIIFSFHYLGRVNRGLMACTAFIYFPERKPQQGLQPNTDLENGSQFGETHVLCDQPFYFSYQDGADLDKLKANFRAWLNQAVTAGLAEWAQRL